MNMNILFSCISIYLPTLNSNCQFVLIIIIFYANIFHSLMVGKLCFSIFFRLFVYFKEILIVVNKFYRVKFGFKCNLFITKIIFDVHSTFYKIKKNLQNDFKIIQSVLQNWDTFKEPSVTFLCTHLKNVWQLL